MDKAKIKQLAKDSFEGFRINQEKVKRISKLLGQSDLKEYIKALKAIEQNKTIILMVPNDKISNVSQIGKKIQKLYPSKRVEVKIDPQLIAGIKVINNDLIYEVSLKQILEEAIDSV